MDPVERRPVGDTLTVEQSGASCDPLDEQSLDGSSGEQRAPAGAGGFYGGWITAAVVGPFKGEPGTLGW